MADNALCQNEAGKVSAAGRVDSRLCVWREGEGGRQQEGERGRCVPAAARSLRPGEPYTRFYMCALPPRARRWRGPPALTPCRAWLVPPHARHRRGRVSVRLGGGYLAASEEATPVGQSARRRRRAAAAATYRSPPPPRTEPEDAALSVGRACLKAGKFFPRSGPTDLLDCGCRDTDGRARSLVQMWRDGGRPPSFLRGGELVMRRFPKVVDSSVRCLGIAARFGCRSCSRFG